MLEKIFSVKNKDIYKVITIFGKQINIKSGKRILLKLIADNLIIKQKLVFYAYTSPIKSILF